MIDYLSRYLTAPPHTASEQLTSRLHPPSSCALVTKRPHTLR